MTTPTIDQVMAEVMVAVNDRDPYVYGGISLYHGADCSGMLYEAIIAAGGPAGARTSEAQFAAWTPAPGPGYGIAVFFDVPSDGASQPAHVGICTSTTQMAEEPHTGLDAEIVQIPNIPGMESVMGYRYLPVNYGSSAAPATPSAPAQEVPDLSNFPGAVAAAATSSGKGAWIVTNNGNVYTSGDAQEYGTLFTAGVKDVTNIVGIFRSWGGNGYYLVGADGAVFCFGDATPAQPIESYPGLPAADRQGDRTFGGGSFQLHWGGAGYTLIALDGSFYAFGS